MWQILDKSSKDIKCFHSHPMTVSCIFFFGVLMGIASILHWLPHV